MNKHLSALLTLVTVAALVMTGHLYMDRPSPPSSTAADEIIKQEQLRVTPFQDQQVSAAPTAATTTELSFCRGGQGYTCQGAAYNDFADRMLLYSEQLRQNSTTWGRRAFPLPANRSVFIFGNSHTRQLYKTLVCQYSSKLRQQYPHDYGESYNYSVFGSTQRWEFINNSTIIAVSNSPLVYRGNKWMETFESLLHRPISSFDAIIVGRFNGLLTESTSLWAQSLQNFSKERPDMFDAKATAPSVVSIAKLFPGPVIAVPMFALYDKVVRASATEAIGDWAQSNATRTGPRTNIRLVDARKHVNVLGECSTDNSSGWSVCLNAGDNPGGRNPKDMHRCTGEKGGHPDLTSWDLIEELYDVLH